ncbi:MAG: response regulator transcription factor [Actinomycetota bacterium]|nr:response regulator transcription factor [Actinomycetota bacterium]
MASALGFRPEVRVVDEETVNGTVVHVAVAVADEVDDETVRLLRRLQRTGRARVVLVVTRIDDGGLLAAIEAGACGVLRRAEASPERLVTAVRTAAAGDGTVPPDLLGRLLDQVGQLQRNVLSPRGLSFSGVSDREAQVLRLVADGFDTAHIARQLSYSERTVKNVLHDVTARLQLRNRSHAVAYALRAGII